jgi:multidrug transporter EmrE-like cation transporter
VSWIYLKLAIVLGVAGTVCLKSQGFTQLLPWALTFVFYALSFSSLALALKASN